MQTPKLPTLQNIAFKLLVARQAVFLFLVVLVISAAAYISGQNLIKEQWRETVLLSQKAGDYIDSASLAISILANAPSMKGELETLQKNNHIFDVLYRINRNGRLEEIAPPEQQMDIGMDMSAQPVFNSDLNTLSVSDPFISARTGNPTVTISAPVVNNNGILVGELSLKGLQESIAGANINQIGIFYIVDQNGYLLVHPDYEKVRRQENIRSLGIIDRIRTGNISQIYFADSELVVSNILPIPKTGWWAITQAPVIAVYGSFFIPAMGGLLLAFLLFVIFTYQEQAEVTRQMVDPLHELSLQTQRMAAGAYKSGEIFFQQSPAYAEVSSLADSFKRMEQAVKAREAALLQSETRYRELFEDSPVSLFEEDFSDLKVYLDGLRNTGIKDWRTYFESHPQAVEKCAGLVRVVGVNKATLEMLKINDPEEALNRLSFIFTEDSFDTYKEELIALAEGKNVFEAENSYHAIDGMTIYASMRLNILPGYENIWSKVLVSLTDITERKRAEKALHESEANFRTFFDTIDDMILVGTPDGRIIYTNVAVTNKLGYSAAELCDMFILDLNPSDKRSEAEEILASMFRLERASCPLPMQTKSGALIPVDTRVWVGKWNGIDCIFGVCKDLSAEQEAQQRFESLFRNNPSPMALTSLDTRFTDVNDAFLNILGYSRVELVGKTSEELELFTQPEIQKVIGQELLRQGRIQNIELKVRRKDGRILDGLFSGEIIESQDQISFLTVMVDITARKQAESALAQERNLLRTLIDIIPDAIYAMDSKGRKILTNPADMALMGLESEAESLGKTDAELYTFQPDQAADFMAVNALVLNNDQPLINIEESLWDSSGKQHWLLTSKIPLHGLDGEVFGLVGIGRKITERKQAEEFLRENEFFQRTLLENLTSGVIIVDAETHVIENVNKAAAILFGAPADQFTGKKCFQCLCPALENQCPITDLNQELDNKECDFQQVDGTVLPVLKSARRIMIKGRAKIMENFIDITDRKKNEEKLRVAQKLSEIGTLTAGIAHEMNTPLQVITGSADSLLGTLKKDGQIDSERFIRYLESISRNGWRIAELVRALNLYARPSDSQIKFHNLNDIIRDTLLLMNHQLKSWTNINIELGLAEDLQPVQCNQSEVNQVLINLLTNARDAMPDGGKISISTIFESQSDEVILEVKDDGLGIPLEIQNRIFDPFFSTKPIDKGTGLGLSVVDGIMRSYGGRISFNSVPKEGTSFTLSFPRQIRQADINEKKLDLGRFT